MLRTERLDFYTALLNTTETGIARLTEADANLVLLDTRLAHLEIQTRPRSRSLAHRLRNQALQQWNNLSRRLLLGGEPIYSVDDAWSIHVELDRRMDALEALFRHARRLEAIHY